MEKINILALKQSIKPAAKSFFSDIKCLIEALIKILVPFFSAVFAAAFVIYSIYDLIINGSYVLSVFVFFVLMISLFVFYIYDQYKKSLRKIKSESKDLK